MAGAVSSCFGAAMIAGVVLAQEGRAPFFISGNALSGGVETIIENKMSGDKITAASVLLGMIISAATGGKGDDAQRPAEKAAKEAAEKAVKEAKEKKGTTGDGKRISNGMEVTSSEALDMAQDFLGPGYRDLGNGRYLSRDGTRVVRMGDSDILWKHGGGPHMHFETLVPNPAKPLKMMLLQNQHIYITD